jgi:hypothetical protein
VLLARGYVKQSEVCSVSARKASSGLRSRLGGRIRRQIKPVGVLQSSSEIVFAESGGEQKIKAITIEPEAGKTTTVKPVLDVSTKTVEEESSDTIEFEEPIEAS